MKLTLLMVVFGLAVLASSSPLPQTPSPPSSDKSAFAPAFDEIVVESSLTVKGRSGPTSPQRQGRTRLLVVPTPGTPLKDKASGKAEGGKGGAEDDKGAASDATVLKA